MAGLNNLVSDQTTQATTLPSWMNTAQQNVVNQASIGAAGVPALQNTVAQGAINQLNSPTNPFATSQGTLGSIASGAANPWIAGRDRSPCLRAPPTTPLQRAGACCSACICPSMICRPRVARGSRAGVAAKMAAGISLYFAGVS